jgi:hypothetical protein
MTGILWAVPLEPFYLPPRHPNIPDRSHITLAYGVERSTCEVLLGKQFTAQLMAEFWNEKAHAIALRCGAARSGKPIGVLLPEHIHCQNKAPHITVSWADGACANDSNEMLAGGKFVRSLGGAAGIELRFEIQFYEWVEEA